jgi:hypothetical protein
VPTIYTDSPSLLPLLSSITTTKNHPASNIFHTTRAIKTNQYAVTSQSHKVGENYVPGIFVKFDIEPVMLAIVEEKSGFWRLVVRIVNVISGVMVAGSWAWQLTDWGIEIVGRKRKRRRGDEVGVLGTPSLEKKSWD